MEINLNNVVQSANPATTNNTAGVAAPQNQDQRADVNATRVVSAKETAHLEDQASSSEQKRFESVKGAAAKFISGANPFLNDIKFTIYGTSAPARVGEYVIRFTDLGTGSIEVKTEAELLGVSGGGNLVSGSI